MAELTKTPLDYGRAGRAAFTPARVGAECGIAVALGVRASGGPQLAGIWISAGLLLGLLVALNKVENDLVHVSRHYAGLSQLQDAEQVRVPSGGALRSARRRSRATGSASAKRTGPASARVTST